MPELPEVEALAQHLREHRIIGAGRHGKFLALHTDGPALVLHLARAGWLRWSDSLAPAAPGQGTDRAAGAPERRSRF